MVPSNIPGYSSTRNLLKLSIKFYTESHSHTVTQSHSHTVTHHTDTESHSHTDTESHSHRVTHHTDTESHITQSQSHTSHRVTQTHSHRVTHHTESHRHRVTQSHITQSLTLICVSAESKPIRMSIISKLLSDSLFLNTALSSTHNVWGDWDHLKSNIIIVLFSIWLLYRIATVFCAWKGLSSNWANLKKRT